MKCFEVVLKVLDATYEQVPGDETTRDAAISRALTVMSNQYRNLLSNGGPNFADPATRFAYVYEYVPANAHWLYELITQSEQAAQLFNGTNVRMTCLGGGPGSDLVGVLKFMTERNLSTRLFCEIIDGCIEWKRTWSDFAFNLPDCQSTIHTDYVVHDVADPKTWQAPSNSTKADLFTLSFFVSEITPVGENSKKYLREVLGSAKPGSVVLMNDNNDSRFLDWFDSVAKDAGLTQLVANGTRRNISDWSEDCSILGRYKDKFGRNSRLQGQVACRVLQKQ